MGKAQQRQMIANIPAVTKIVICKKHSDAQFRAYARGEEPDDAIIFRVLGVRFDANTGVLTFKQDELYQPKPQLMPALNTAVSKAKLQLIQDLQRFAREEVVAEGDSLSDPYYKLVPTRQDIAHAITSLQVHPSSPSAANVAGAAMGGSL